MTNKTSDLRQPDSVLAPVSVERVKQLFNIERFENVSFLKKILPITIGIIRPFEVVFIQILTT